MAIVNIRSRRGPANKALDDLLFRPALSIKDLLTDNLYAGIGGRLGRMGIYLGIDPVDQSPKYLGYETQGRSNIPVLVSEVNLRKDKDDGDVLTGTYAGGTFFTPQELICPVPEGLSDHNLLDWIIKQDLEHLHNRLNTIKDLGQRMGATALYNPEISDLEARIATTAALRT